MTIFIFTMMHKLIHIEIIRRWISWGAWGIIIDDFTFISAPAPASRPAFRKWRPIIGIAISIHFQTGIINITA